MKIGRLGLGVALIWVASAGACGSDGAQDGGAAGEQAAGGSDAAGAGPDDGGSAGAGPAGSAGVENGAGDGGTAGAAGAAGMGGAGEPPVVSAADCNGKAIELDAERVRQCVLLTSCSPIGSADGLGSVTSECVLGGIDGFSFHLSDDAPGVPYQLDGRIQTCLGGLRTCDDVLACTGVRYPVDECKTDETSRCDGELAINCGDGASVQDCQKLTGEKGQCKVLGEGAAAHAECVVADDCETTAERSECAGNLAWNCPEQGFAWGVNCAALGLECRQYDRGASCVAPLPEAKCDSPGAGSCDGSKLSYCGLGGVAFERDCSALGELSCVKGTGDRPEDSPWFDCSPAACDVRFEPNDACDGDDLVIDLGMGSDGARLHCPDYGFATCRNDRCSN